MHPTMNGERIEENGEAILLTRCVRCSRHCRLKLWLDSERQQGHSCARGAVYGHRFRKLWKERQAAAETPEGTSEYGDGHGA